MCLQEMLQKGHVVTQETFHYLLMGCLKDKETGFRLALQVEVLHIFFDDNYSVNHECNCQINRSLSVM